MIDRAAKVVRVSVVALGLLAALAGCGAPDDDATVTDASAGTDSGGEETAVQPPTVSVTADESGPDDTTDERNESDDSGSASGSNSPSTSTTSSTTSTMTTTSTTTDPYVDSEQVRLAVFLQSGVTVDDAADRIADAVAGVVVIYRFERQHMLGIVIDSDLITEVESLDFVERVKIDTGN